MKKFFKNAFDLLFDIFLWFMVFGCCGIAYAVARALPRYGITCLACALAMVTIIRIQQKLK